MYLACTWQEAQKHHSKRKLKTTIREGVTYLNQYLGSQGKSVCLRMCVYAFFDTHSTHTSSASSSIGRLELWTRPMKAMSSRILFHQKRKLKTTKHQKRKLKTTIREGITKGSSKPPLGRGYGQGKCVSVYVCVCMCMYVYVCVCRKFRKGSSKPPN